jgi:hypothetical protein
LQTCMEDCRGVRELMTTVTRAEKAAKQRQLCSPQPALSLAKGASPGFKNHGTLGTPSRN